MSDRMPPLPDRPDLGQVVHISPIAQYTARLKTLPALEARGEVWPLDSNPLAPGRAIDMAEDFLPDSDPTHPETTRSVSWLSQESAPDPHGAPMYNVITIERGTDDARRLLVAADFVIGLETSYVQYTLSGQPEQGEPHEVSVWLPGEASQKFVRPYERIAPAVTALLRAFFLQTR